MWFNERMFIRTHQNIELTPQSSNTKISPEDGHLVKEKYVEMIIHWFAV